MLNRNSQDRRVTLITTPIGNLGDLSIRAKECLEHADLVIAEDTRVTQKLYQLLEIDYHHIEFLSFHEHNQDQVETLVSKIVSFENPIIVSDAGSPVLSDPAYPLVKHWLDLGYDIESLPGPSAVLLALELSGLPPLPFEFSGFLPRKKEALKRVFQGLVAGKTTLFFESPHRIIDSLNCLCCVLPEADIFVGRELTKKFEQHWRFKGSQWSEIKKSIKAKGEFVLAINHPGEKGNERSASSLELKTLAEDYMEKPSSKKMAKLLAEITGKKTSDIYEKLKKD